MVGAGLGGDTARQDCEGSRPHGSDRLLIKPAAMVTRPVPAVRGHFERKARPATAGYEGATRAASTSLHAPAPGEQPACLPQESNQPACRRTAGYDPSHSPCRHQPDPEPRRAPQAASQSRTAGVRARRPVRSTPRRRRAAWQGPCQPTQRWYRIGGGTVVIVGVLPLPTVHATALQAGHSSPNWCYGQHFRQAA